MSESILPDTWMSSLLGAMGLCELGVAVLLVHPRTWRLGLQAALALCLLLTASLLAMRIAGWDIESCGCFGDLRAPVLVHYALVFGVAGICLSCVLDREAEEGSTR